MKDLTLELSLVEMCWLQDHMEAQVEQWFDVYPEEELEGDMREDFRRVNLLVDKLVGITGKPEPSTRTYKQARQWYRTYLNY